MTGVSAGSFGGDTEFRPGLANPVESSAFPERTPKHARSVEVLVLSKRQTCWTPGSVQLSGHSPL